MMGRLTGLLLGLFIMLPCAAFGDDTATLQAEINAGSMAPPCGVYNVTGLVISNAVRIYGGGLGCVIIHATANAPIFSCSSQAGQIDIVGITGTGTGANYTGYGTGPSDAGQHGIALSDCTHVHISDVSFTNLSGNALDCAAPSSAFNSDAMLRVEGLEGSSNFRVLYTHNYCEYGAFSNIVARKNVFGAEIASGNITLSNFDFVFNSVGLKLSGSSTNGNPCHGQISNGALNHNTYAFIAQSCGLGEAISNVSAIGDQSGGITSGSVGIYFYNSRMIVWNGGGLGNNIATVAADPSTGSGALSGLNSMMNMYVRDDLANFVPPSIGSGAGLSLKGNMTASGPWSANN